MLGITLFNLKLIVYVLAVIIAVGIGLSFFSTPIKTLLLITKVSPYEQAGTGAGSILIVGDSTGYGTGTSTADDSIAGRLGADYPGYAIKNNSVNGRKIAGAQAVINGLTERYDLILLQIGANDMLAGTPVPVVTKDMETLIAGAKEHADNVVVMTAGNIGGAARFTGEKEMALQQASLEYTAHMNALAVDGKVHFVDLYDDPAEDQFVLRPSVYLANDGLHPSSVGYGIWYAKLKRVVQSLLE